jgi:hypothetical protein
MPHHRTWTEETVKAWLREAADTLKRLPRADLRPRLTLWPEVVRSAAEVAMLEPSRLRRAAPAPAAIDRLDKVLSWLLACDEEARRMVWARACGISWRRLEDIDGRSHMTLRKVEDRGLRSIYLWLRKHPDMAPMANGRPSSSTEINTQFQ